MAISPPGGESQIAQGFFNGLYEDAIDLVGEAEMMRTRQQPGTGLIIIPGSNLRLTQRERNYPGASAVSDHVNLDLGRMLRGRGHAPLLSTTRVYQDEGQPYIPISVASYRGEEEFPDFFLKQDPVSRDIVCRIGAAGLSEGEESGRLTGETVVPMEAKFGDMAEEDRLRLTLVSLAITDRIGAIRAVTEALALPGVMRATYTGGEPDLMRHGTG